MLNAHHSLKLETALEQFIDNLRGKNRSESTVRAYQCDLVQFFTWLHQNNTVIVSPTQVERLDIIEYLAHLADRKVSGTSRARKIAAIREYFRFLVDGEELVKSPAASISIAKKEKKNRVYLEQSEYSRMLALAAPSPRDSAILQTFLQTGVRVSELCQLRLDDVSFTELKLRVQVGKGMKGREIELEKKVIAALKSYLRIRPTTVHDYLFVNRWNEPISERGVRDIVLKYREAAGIKKAASCHSLRHTFATYKARQGVSAFQLMEWLGHAELGTTQIYVHMGREGAQKAMEATSL
jgi:site-specific recombinase XerD